MEEALVINRWLKTTGIYSLAVLEVGGLRLRYQQGWFLLATLRENACQASLWWPPAVLGIPWLADASPQSLPLSPHGFLYAYVSVLNFLSAYKDQSLA